MCHQDVLIRDPDEGEIKVIGIEQENESGQEKRDQQQ